MASFRGYTLSVQPFDGVFGSSWYAVATKTGEKSLEGPIRHIKLLAWIDAYLLALGVEKTSPSS